MVAGRSPQPRLCDGGRRGVAIGGDAPLPPEAEDLDLAISRNEEALPFDVAMLDSALMRGGKIGSGLRRTPRPSGRRRFRELRAGRLSL